MSRLSTFARGLPGAGDGLPLTTVGQRYKRVGRWVLWTVIVGGVISVLTLAAVRTLAPPKVVALVAMTQGNPGLDAARARAEVFARAYLSWSPETLERRQHDLEMMLADGAGADAMASPAGSQRVLSAWASQSRVRGQAAWVVVACVVARGGTTSTIYLGVPVAWTLHADGDVASLVVYDTPSIVAPPAKAAAPDSAAVPMDDRDGDAIASLLTRFFDAYLAGGSVPPEFLTAVAARDDLIRPLGLSYTLAGDVSADDLQQIGPGDGSRQIAVAVRARDTAGSVLDLRYRVIVRRATADSRWLVQDLT